MEEGGDADVEMDEEDLADVKSALDTLQDKLAPLLGQAAVMTWIRRWMMIKIWVMMPDMDMDMDDKEPDMDMDMEDDEDMEQSRKKKS